MSFLGRFFMQTPPVRWWYSAVFWTRGIKLHPAAWLNCKSSQLRLETGTSIGARTRVELNKHASLLTGKNVWLSSDIEIQTDTIVAIGSRTTVQRRSTINGSVRIGADCIIAPNVFISSGTHSFRITPHLPIRHQEMLERTNGKSCDRPILIQDDCWLGVNTVICPGVTIGRGSVIGANAVVTHDIPPYSVATGIPARVTGQRMEWTPQTEIDLRRLADHPYLLLGKIIYQPSGDPIGVEMDIDNPLCVALASAKNGSLIELAYETKESVVLHIRGKNYSLLAESSVITLPLTVLEATQNHDLLRAELHTDYSSQSVRIFTFKYRAAE